MTTDHARSPTPDDFYPGSDFSPKPSLFQRINKLQTSPGSKFANCSGSRPAAAVQQPYSRRPSFSGDASAPPTMILPRRLQSLSSSPVGGDLKSQTQPEKHLRPSLARLKLHEQGTREFSPSSSLESEDSALIQEDYLSQVKILEKVQDEVHGFELISLNEWSNLKREGEMLSFRLAQLEAAMHFNQDQFEQGPRTIRSLLVHLTTENQLLQSAWDCWRRLETCHRITAETNQVVLSQALEANDGKLKGLVKRLSVIAARFKGKPKAAIEKPVISDKTDFACQTEEPEVSSERSNQTLALKQKSIVEQIKYETMLKALSQELKQTKAEKIQLQYKLDDLQDVKVKRVHVDISDEEQLLLNELFELKHQNELLKTQLVRFETRQK